MVSSDGPPVCPECGFSIWLPLANLDVSSLGFYDDARYPGRCLLVLNEHHEEFSDLAPDLTERFVADAQRAARASARKVALEYRETEDTIASDGSASADPSDCR